MLTRRRRKGLTIAETAAAMVLLIPLLFLVLYIVLEASKAYFLKEELSQGARQAARDLAVEYGKNPSIAENSTQQENVLNNVRIPNVINDAQQFEEVNFDPAGSPPSVTVTVYYRGGQYGLPPFPHPDPLNLGSNFTLSATSTYRLE